jgi:hypothetical protein
MSTSLDVPPTGVIGCAKKASIISSDFFRVVCVKKFLHIQSKDRPIRNQEI